ncbi:MAG: AtpZ/AtpI family protein [Bacteroidota bacterium]
MTKPKRKSLNNYVKFSGMAFQMIAVIGLFVWGGMQLDAYFQLSFPAFLVGLSLTGVLIAMLQIIRSLPKY